MRLNEFYTRDFFIDSQTGKEYGDGTHQQIAQSLGFKDTDEALMNGFIRYKVAAGEHAYNLVATPKSIATVKKHIREHDNPDNPYQSWVIQYDILNDRGEIIESDADEFHNQLAALSYLVRIQRSL